MEPRDAKPHCGKHLRQEYQSNDLSTGGLMVGHQLKQQMHLLRNKQLGPLTPL